MAEVWRPKPVHVYQDWVYTIRDEAWDRLTSWEREFIDSLEGKLAFGWDLSRKQAEALEKIYAERTH